MEPASFDAIPIEREVEVFEVYLGDVRCILTRLEEKLEASVNCKAYFEAEQWVNIELHFVCQFDVVEMFDPDEEAFGSQRVAVENDAG